MRPVTQQPPGNPSGSARIGLREGPEVGVAPELQLGRDGSAHIDAAGALSVDVAAPLGPPRGDQH